MHSCHLKSSVYVIFAISINQNRPVRGDFERFWVVLVENSLGNDSIPEEMTVFPCDPSPQKFLKPAFGGIVPPPQTQFSGGHPS